MRSCTARTSPMAVAFCRIVNSWLRVALRAVSRAWMSEYWAVTSWPWVVIDLTVPMPRTRDLVRACATEAALDPPAYRRELRLGALRADQGAEGEDPNHGDEADGHAHRQPRPAPSLPP